MVIERLRQSILLGKWSPRRWSAIGPPRPRFARVMQKGESTASLARDHAILRGPLVVTPLQSYDVHQMVSMTGMTASMRHTGRVFAVTWTGTQVPDLLHNRF